MNHDVDDPEKGHMDAVINGRGKGIQNKQRSQNILTRIRNFNISSIGSAFSGSLSAISSYVTQEGTDNNYEFDSWGYENDLEAGRISTHSGTLQDYYDETHHAIESSTPTQTRSSSPMQIQSGRLSEVKRLFLSRFYPVDSDHMSTTTNNWNVNSSCQNHPPLYAPSVYEWDEASGTPPLTPDSFDDLNIPSPPVPGDFDYDEESAIEAIRDSAKKEGKKPDRSFEDIPLHDLSPSEVSSPVAAYDNRDEWYGLEYTLELSCRERLPSDTKSAGEHSRSRESWAAIHQGTMHPFFEDEEYYHWKNWHRYLDRQDERKKHRRGFEFKARSKDLAWFYVDEMHTRDLLYWQKEVYGVVGRDVKERLKMLADHRPDPYFPPKKHNLGWYLKRSLSVGCLRELSPRPGLKQQIIGKPRKHGASPSAGFSFDDNGVLITK